MPVDPYDPELGWRKPLPGARPITAPPAIEGDLPLLGVGGRYPDPDNPSQGGWLRPVEKPIPVPQPSGLLPVLDFRPDRIAWVYPTVTPRIPAPRPSSPAIGSLTDSILYNNVNYASQPKLKPINN